LAAPRGDGGKKSGGAIIVMAGAIDAMPFCVKHSARSLPAAMP
jgi:hypothetical protein